MVRASQYLTNPFGQGSKPSLVANENPVERQSIKSNSGNIQRLSQIGTGVILSSSQEEDSDEEEERDTNEDTQESRNSGKVKIKKSEIKKFQYYPEKYFIFKYFGTQNDIFLYREYYLQTIRSDILLLIIGELFKDKKIINKIKIKKIENKYWTGCLIKETSFKIFLTKINKNQEDLNTKKVQIYFTKNPFEIKSEKKRNLFSKITWKIHKNLLEYINNEFELNFTEENEKEEEKEEEENYGKGGKMNKIVIGFQSSSTLVKSSWDYFYLLFLFSIKKYKIKNTFPFLKVDEINLFTLLPEISIEKQFIQCDFKIKSKLSNSLMSLSENSANKNQIKFNPHEKIFEIILYSTTGTEDQQIFIILQKNQFVGNKRLSFKNYKKYEKYLKELKMLHHPTIMKLIDFIQPTFDLMIEYVPHFNLEYLIRSNSIEWNLLSILKILINILDALSYLYTKNPIIYLNNHLSNLSEVFIFQSVINFATKSIDYLNYDILAFISLPSFPFSSSPAPLENQLEKADFLEFYLLFEKLMNFIDLKEHSSVIQQYITDLFTIFKFCTCPSPSFYYLPSFNWIKERLLHLFNNVLLSKSKKSLKKPKISRKLSCSDPTGSDSAASKDGGGVEDSSDTDDEMDYLISPLHPYYQFHLFYSIENNLFSIFIDLLERGISLYPSNLNYILSDSLYPVHLYPISPFILSNYKLNSEFIPIRVDLNPPSVSYSSISSLPLPQSLDTAQENQQPPSSANSSLNEANKLFLITKKYNLNEKEEKGRKLEQKRMDNKLKRSNPLSTYQLSNQPLFNNDPKTKMHSMQLSSSTRPSPASAPITTAPSSGSQLNPPMNFIHLHKNYLFEFKQHFGYSYKNNHLSLLAKPNHQLNAHHSLLLHQYRSISQSTTNNSAPEPLASTSNPLYATEKQYPSIPSGLNQTPSITGAGGASSFIDNEYYLFPITYISKYVKNKYQQLSNIQINMNELDEDPTNPVNISQLPFDPLGVIPDSTIKKLLFHYHNLLENLLIYLIKEDFIQVLERYISIGNIRINSNFNFKNHENQTELNQTNSKAKTQKGGRSPLRSPGSPSVQGSPGTNKLGHQERKGNHKYLIHYVCKYNKLKMMKILLKHGINISKTTMKYNETALHIATTRCYLPLIKLLLKNKINLTIKNHQNQTGMMCGCISTNIDCIILLLSYYKYLPSHASILRLTPPSPSLSIRDSQPYSLKVNHVLDDCFFSAILLYFHKQQSVIHTQILLLFSQSITLSKFNDNYQYLLPFIESLISNILFNPSPSFLPKQHLVSSLNHFFQFAPDSMLFNIQKHLIFSTFLCFIFLILLQFQFNWQIPEKAGSSIFARKINYPSIISLSSLEFNFQKANIDDGTVKYESVPVVIRNNTNKIQSVRLSVDNFCNHFLEINPPLFDLPPVRFLILFFHTK